jgi:cytidine deaminase
VEKKYKKLVNLAIKAMDKAYTPYSKYNVGAALLTNNDKIYTGCNIENASYGLTVCAERVAILKAVSEEERKIKVLAIANSTNEISSPCGACRQVMVEFMEDDDIIILSNNKGDYIIKVVKELLPNAFKLKE